MEQMKTWYDQVKKYQKRMNITVGIALLSLFFALGSTDAVDNNSISLVQYYVQIAISLLATITCLWYYKMLETKCRRIRRHMRTYMKRKENAA